MTSRLVPFLKRLGHRFDRPELLELALSHRSLGGEHNERLEFLGDAVLGMVIAEALYQTFGAADEGQLSRLRSKLVKRDTLAALARILELGSVLRMGPGELGSGGQERSSTLADTLEAIIGAIYLDAGFDTAKSFILNLYAEQLDQLDPGQADKDPKTRLQERMQAKNQDLPDYEVIEISGQQHNQRFVLSCRLPSSGQQTRGVGSSRRRAEQAAATAMLELLDGR